MENLDFDTLIDRFLPPELQDGYGWHAGRIAITVGLAVLFLVSAWRTTEFMLAVLEGTTFKYMTYLGLAAFDGALLMWHVAHDKASTPAQAGISTIMWGVSLVSMLGTNLGDIIWTANASALSADMLAMKESIVNVLLLAIPLLTIAHIAAGTIYVWADPGISLAIKRRRAVGESRNALITHGTAMTKLHLKAEAARKFAEAERDVMAVLEAAAALRSGTAHRQKSVWAQTVGVPYEEMAGTDAFAQAPVPAGERFMAAAAPAPVRPGRNGHGHDPSNIVTHTPPSPPPTPSDDGFGDGFEGDGFGPFEE